MLGWNDHVTQGAKTYKSAEVHFKVSLKHNISWSLVIKYWSRTTNVFTVKLVLCQAKFNPGLSPDSYGSVSYFFDFTGKRTKMETYKVKISSNAIHMSFVNEKYKGKGEHLYRFTI